MASLLCFSTRDLMKTKNVSLKQPSIFVWFKQLVLLSYVYWNGFSLNCFANLPSHLWKVIKTITTLHFSHDTKTNFPHDAVLQVFHHHVERVCYIIISKNMYCWSPDLVLTKVRCFIWFVLGQEMKPGMDSEENRWNHYNEFVFVRTWKWFPILCTFSWL